MERTHCSDGTECWTPRCCGEGMPCLRWVRHQAEPGPPEPFTIDLDQSEWKPIAEKRKFR
jgi:hypothetical protein